MKFTHPVLSCAEAMQWEEKLLAGDPGREWAAMSRAGRAIGRAVIEDWREAGGPVAGGSLLILAGKGHNTGDAFIAAVEIFGRVSGLKITVLFTAGERALRPLVLRAWRDLQDVAGGSVRSHSLSSREPVSEWLDERFGGTYWDVALDGVLGMQFRPPVRPPLDAVLEWVNRRARIGLRAAVDLPSGMGDVSADEPFRADFTYMPGIPKRPLFAAGAAKWSGRLRYCDLGFFDEGEPVGGSETEAVPAGGENVRLIRPAILAPLARFRDPLRHKKHYGHLFLVGGSRTLPGAILMSALAAVRSGVGLVSAFVPESLAPAFAARLPEVMWVPWPEGEAGGLSPDGRDLLRERMGAATALALGPGLGKDEATHVLAREIVAATACPLLLDADALTRPIVEAAASRTGGPPVVLTPHAGEFARIAGDRAGEGSDEALSAFCRDLGVVTVFKGPPFSRIADGTRLWYAATGGPVLARGGSGDIMTGLLGGLLAGAGDEPVLETVARGVYWHGAAADCLARRRGATAVCATDLPDYFGEVLATGAEDRIVESSGS